MIKQDDYRLRNGTVLEYTESGYDRTDSEYECAKSWLIKGDPGTFKNNSHTVVLILEIGRKSVEQVHPSVVWL